ncbi:MAG: DUF5103 domain-containing protein [Ignavibacteriales bacterium]|nr:DUF5103 domain-containing protein [Ignavibacteriales bacterium]
MKKIPLLLLALSSILLSRSDVEILGLRVYGNGDEYRPPIIGRSEVISIDFDVTTTHPPNLQIIFKHASKDWVVDDNLFVNEPSKVMTDYLAYAAAPNAVYHYTYSYRNSFPNKRNRVEFVFSGNYKFYIIDHDENDQVLAEGKFIVTEEIVTTSMSIANKYYTESGSPLNQVNFITVNVGAPNEYNVNEPNSIYHSDIKTVDIIQNWRITLPYRIDLDDRSPETFVDDFMKPNKKFWIRNVPTANEYRRLNLSNATTYPNHKLATLIDGPDLSRFQWQGKPDANGASKLKPFVGANSDYIEVELRLRLAGRIINHDWLTLEGNDWRTVNRYTALIYYRDRRYGGFDRVVGVVRGRSPGGDEGKSITFPEQTIVNPRPIPMPR